MPETDCDRIHQVVVDGFRSLGATNPEAVSRTILLRDGWLLGHRFLCEGFQAIHRAGSGEIAFYDNQGKLLETVPIETRSTPAAA